MAEDKDKLMFAHSGCCNAHWEVVYNMETKEFHLACENCGMASPDFEVKGPEFEHPPECDCCKQEKKVDEVIQTDLFPEDDDGEK